MENVNERKLLQVANVSVDKPCPIPNVAYISSHIFLLGQDRLVPFELGFQGRTVVIKDLQANRALVLPQARARGHVGKHQTLDSSPLPARALTF